MIIYTNKGNPLGLKLIILANLAKRQNIDVKFVEVSDPVIKEIKQLPVLELDSGVQLFSTNAIAKYFFPNEDNEDLRNQWLDWSTTLLAPALCHNMGSGHRTDPNALIVLNALLKQLNDELEDKLYLTGSKLSTADISVWCLLSPNDTLKNAHNIDNLLKWYNTIEKLNEIKMSLKQFNIKTLKELNFSSIQHSNNYGGLNHIVLTTKLNATKANLLSDPNLSPTHIAETVTNDELQLAKKYFIEINLNDYNINEEKIVLPKENERNVLVTSALPYVNNVPHLGNIIGCVLSADIFARYSRSCGYNTLFISGTDEYGTATETKAMAENLTPKQICDKYFELHNSIYRWFGIGFDYFGRTTTPEQTEIVQSIFKDIYENGYIITESVEQLLCQKCDRYLADRFVEGTCPYPNCGYEDARGDQCDKCGKLINATELIRPRCKICSTAPVLRNSDQLFLNLPKIEPQLRKWVEEKDHGWTNNARVITQSWLKEGLKSRCITRDLKWGIPVPLSGFENKVFYVWFDAPIGYISITKRYTKDYNKWWKPDNSCNYNIELFQFMAKDNVPFHSVMFPSTLLSLNKGHTLVSHIMATEYLNYEDGKFSKSRGIGVFGNDAQDTGIPSDVWRFYLASARPEGQDSTFSWNELATRNNSELLNNLGNFINRALVFCERNFNSVIPKMILNDNEYILLALVNREIKGYINSMEKAKYRDGIRHILSISKHGNQYMQSTQPWVLLKGTDDDKTKAGTVIGLCSNLASILAKLLFPFMPTISRIINSQLNIKQTRLDSSKPYVSIHLQTGHKINKPTPLFQKIDQKLIDELKKKYSGEQHQQQNSNQTEKNVNNEQQLKDEPSISFKSVAEAEEAIFVQGQKIRQLKVKGLSKSEAQPEINILLKMEEELKRMKQIANNELSPESYKKDEERKFDRELRRLRIKKKNYMTDPSLSPNSKKLRQLEDQIDEQAFKVQHLKISCGPHIWKPEAEKLIVFENELKSFELHLLEAKK